MAERSSAWPSSIGVITLFVDDLGASKDFYLRAFGTAVVFEDPHSVVFKVGDTLVNLLVRTAAPELVEPAPVAPQDPGARCVFTIPVDDVDAVCAELRIAGVALLNGPIDRPWGPRTASFRDPSGHIWEIAH